MDFNQLFNEQLTLDCSCSLNEIINDNNIFTKKKYLNNRRNFQGDDCILRIICLKNKLIATTDSNDLLAWCKDIYKSANSAWFFEFQNLYKLNKKLNSLGHYIADAHHYYLPIKNFNMEHNEFVVKWYEKEEIFQFKGDKRFTSAISFLPNAPDMLAVTAIENDKILGMAGASADSPQMWQIGINVTNEGKGRQIGTFLVTLLKNEIIKRGILPFYGTVESHIKSQKVAINSGFMPAWSELYSSSF